MGENKLRKIVVFCILISFFLLSLVGTISSQENIIKIGSAISMTGRLAFEGGQLKKGFEVWEDWVNSHGGITAGGIDYKVKIVFYDDESDPVTSAKLTEMLITRDKVDFLFGPRSSGITFATTAIGEKYKMITIAPSANAANIFERGFKYVFAVMPIGSTWMTPVAHMMAEDLHPKPKTIAIITANDLFPLAYSTAFRDLCIEMGFDVVLFEKYPVDTVDISALLTQVKELKPDVISEASSFVGGIRMITQSKELDFNPKLFVLGDGGVTNPNFVKELGTDAEYVIAPVFWTPDMKNTDTVFGTTASYVQACKDKFGPDFIPNYDVSCASTAGILLQLAIEKADSIETEKVREALSSLDVELSTFPAVAFDEKGQNIRWQHPVVQIQNGEIITVYPVFSDEKTIMYPTPEWKMR